MEKHGDKMSQKRSMSKVEEVALCEQVTKIVMQERKGSKIFYKDRHNDEIKLEYDEGVTQ